MTTFALVSSPVVDKATWQPVADILRAHGHLAFIAEPWDPAAGSQLYWPSHALSAATQLLEHCCEPAVLVAHSGAGPLLPAIREALATPVRAYVFVDASIPVDGASRLDLLPAAIAENQRAALVAGGRLPAWTDADLAPIIPDAASRAAVLRGLRRQALAFYAEPISVFSKWPDAPCGYLRLSAAYQEFTDQARLRGWPVRELDGEHFHLVVAPEEVAAAMLDLTAELTDVR